MEAVVDLALAALAAAPGTAQALFGMGSTLEPYTAAASSVISTVAPYIAPGASLLTQALSALSGLIGRANGMGDGFKSSYSELTGSDFVGDVADLFAGVADTNPETAIVACEQLSADIKKAIKALQTREEASLPFTCNNGVRTQCSETFIKDAQDKIAKLNEEIDDLECQARGKLVEQGIHEHALFTCSEYLNSANAACNAAQAPPPSTCSLPPPPPVPTPTPTLPAPTCGCASQPPPPVTKKVCRKPRKRVKITPPPPPPPPPSDYACPYSNSGAYYDDYYDDYGYA
jgi:hypothetical protein